eukprot:RCo033472
MDEGTSTAVVAAEGEDSAALKKRKCALSSERSYANALPNGLMYERSYMHRDTVSHVLVTPVTDFVVTCSVDGHLKFWKKLPKDIIFVKHFRPHLSAITAVALSCWDGQLLCTTSADRSVKVFDVINFDMINMIKLSVVPGPMELICSSANPKPGLLVCDSESPAVHVYDPLDGEGKLLTTVQIHSSPVLLLRFNPQYHTLVSSAADGVLEYWSSSTYKFEKKDVRFALKSETHLFEFAKNRTLPFSLEFSRDGGMFATWARDRKVRVFRFLTGKLFRTYDESIAVYAEMQKEKDSPFVIEGIDFGRRVALEKEVDAAMASGACPPVNVLFDQSGTFIIFSTMLGIKVLNIHTNTVTRFLGITEASERFLQVSLFQGMVRQTQAIYQLTLKEQATPVETDLQEDPELFCAAFRRPRFYIFSRREPADAIDGDPMKGRDVFNEKQTKEELAVQVTGKSGLGSAAVVRTTMGDIHVKLFPEEAPKAVENFCTHSRNGYYNNLIFHRVIKGFMCQTGDPGGDGRGGVSIWGSDFEDEFHKLLKFDRPFTVAMANCGPNTNGSQFFFTTVPTPWLDGKHTIFGRVTKGMDVVQAIEKSKTDRSDKPLKDIKIVNIEVL